ncbi:hypothetical protein IEQ34_009158 [Dendrobium chrysotoxum]|uniref:TFIIS N-terminal domain-containing protein n=1 Tax=Dendrobium chrysotoxum TaxID=161865 RepID=A0AAV7H120_DENCH|nr:hypothetical protein IEQ34_009158 [Dendrobium chrysotoxum]
MQGWDGEKWERMWHMWTVPTLGTEAREKQAVSPQLPALPALSMQSSLDLFPKEEVDQLLDKTEMHEAVQSGGHSPRHLYVPSSTQQLKSGSDNLQNSGTSLSSQVKGKRRDRGDQVTELVKRERISKIDDGNFTGCKVDNNMIKSELSKISEKGALRCTDGVEKLFQLMQVDNSKKIDLNGRVLLADVIAATDTIDCLNKFMQIGGVTILDEWLQEAHKGKTGDGYSPKENDKTVEELLLALLRALDKLPVNLHALQTCNIGKSVNHLRSHKNLEVQKRARSLVDTWKKRVDAEMKMSDAKAAGNSQTVTWQVKPGFSEVSHAGNLRNGSGELSMKSSITQQSMCKGSSGKSVPTDSAKSTTVIVGSGKVQSSSFAPVANISKDSFSKDAVSDLPKMLAKEEKSCSSSQSQNNSQSCSSDHGKTVVSSLKEDARSSTAGSVSKNFSGSSRNRRSSNGFIASNISVGQKESNSGKSGLLIRNTISEKVSQAGLYCDRAADVSPSEHGSCDRVIVKHPNPGCSPARSTSGCSLEDPSVGSRTSSPGVLDKREHVDLKVIVRNDTGRTHIVAEVNAESWQSNKVEGLVGCDEGDRLSMIVPDEEQRNEAEKVMEIPRTKCSLSGNEKFNSVAELKTGDSFSSMNALIESCAKYSEATTPLLGDDIGMNLLASVAAGEMPKPNVVSAASSPKGSPATEDPCCSTNEANARFSSGVGSGNLSPSDENTDSYSLKHVNDIVCVFGKDEIQVAAANCRDVKEELYREDANQSKGGRRIGGFVVEGLTDCKSVVSSPADHVKASSSSHAETSKFTSDSGCKSLFHGIDCEVSASGRDVEKVVIVESSLCRHFNKDLHVGAILTEQKSHSLVKPETGVVDRRGDGAPTSSVAVKAPCLEKADLLNSQNLDGSGDQCLEQSGRNGSAILPSNHRSYCESASSPGGVDNGAQIAERKAVLEKHIAGTDGHDQRPTMHGEIEACATMSADDAEAKEELVASSVEISSFFSNSEQDAGAKLNFDLNEGILGDDVNQTEAISTSAPDCSPSIRISSLSPHASSPMLNGSPSPITVAAPAKGFFMPPEILLKNRGDLGWKGSAATSAFRPAEPRKVLEMSFNSSDVHSFDTAGVKQGRPLLEFDLNVPDERALEDMASQNSAQTTGSESGIISDHDVPSRASGGLDFDLNRLDEGNEDGKCVASISCHFEVPLLHAKPTTTGFPNRDANMLRDFDLNCGPGIDDVGTEPLSRNQKSKKSNNMPFFPPNAGLRMNNTEIGSGWFPPFNSYPAVALPSFMHDREKSYPIVAASGAQRILGPITGAGTFGSDMHRGPVLSSSQTMAYSPAAPTFSYAGFPFGSSFPTASSFTAGTTNYVDSSSGGCSYFPHIPSLVKATGGVSFTRPYMINHPEGSASIGSDGRKWARQSLDLNAGPGYAVDVKDDRLPSSRQLHATSSQNFMDEQARLRRVAGCASKQKETDGGLEPERFTFKHQSWQ